jgi:hypothetical protein
MSTIIASLSWRVLANTFPLAFLAFPLSRFVMDLCLWTEATGICSVAWPLATVHRRILRWKNDEHYLGMRRLEEVDHAVLMRPSISVDLDSNIGMILATCDSHSMTHTNIDVTERDPSSRQRQQHDFEV